jgi:predicted signal transduction protein with EAL and GGDEF domain
MSRPDPAAQLDEVDRLGATTRHESTRMPRGVVVLLSLGIFALSASHAVFDNAWVGVAAYALVGIGCALWARARRGALARLGLPNAHVSTRDIGVSAAFGLAFAFSSALSSTISWVGVGALQAVMFATWMGWLSKLPRRS